MIIWELAVSDLSNASRCVTNFSQLTGEEKINPNKQLALAPIKMRVNEPNFLEECRVSNA